MEEWTKKMYVCVCIYISSINGGMDKEDVCVCVYTHTHTHTHTLEYYSAIKRNDMVPFAATWIDLEIVTLSEVSQRKTNII